MKPIEKLENTLIGNISLLLGKLQFSMVLMNNISNSQMVKPCLWVRDKIEQDNNREIENTQLLK